MMGLRITRVTVLVMVVAAAAVLVKSEQAQKEKIREREETTEKSSAPQVYTYRPTSVLGSVYPNGLYPGTYNTNYNPSYTPTGTYNPTYGGSGGVYPVSGGGVYPVSGGGVYPVSGGGVYPVSGGGVYPVSGVGVGGGQGFTVRRASPLTQQGSRVIFRETVTQSGAGWNAARGEFVAPSSGHYFFSFASMSDRNSHFRMTLRHNGVEVVGAYGDAGGYNMGGQSAVVRLNAGDRVYLQLDEGRLYDATSARPYTVFTGFRLF